jgi:hypothetical protein
LVISLGGGVCPIVMMCVRVGPTPPHPTPTPAGAPRPPPHYTVGNLFPETNSWFSDADPCRQPGNGYTEHSLS